MKKDNLKLYFIAIVPNEPHFSELKAFKTEFKDRFNSKAALRSPPHITLHMPFKWNEEKEDRLIKTLNMLAEEHSPFDLILNDFGAFPPRVIFVKVGENDQLHKLQKAVQKVAKTSWHIYPKEPQRPFRPHMTVAFRDLKKPAFHEAWSQFKDRKYSAQFEVFDICLLKHNGKSWDVLERVQLNTGRRISYDQ
ncbi:MAG: RNA 2',3'-cyclic phosphodiesterase [Bacteroidota bacterium]